MSHQITFQVHRDPPPPVPASPLPSPAAPSPAAVPRTQAGR
jgi:hypothetical protein